MTLLSCPRLQRRQEEDSDPDDSPPVVDETSQDVIQTPIPGGDLDEERRELADLFDPSTPPAPSSATPSSRPDDRTHSLLFRRLSSRSTETPFPLVVRRKSRVSLISLSSKLRKRFSREIHLLRKNSKRAITEGQEGSQHVGEAGEGGDDETYDSDAHYISTPQITQRLDGSPFRRRFPQRLSILSSGSVPDTPSKVPAGFDGASVDDLAAGGFGTHGTRDAAPENPPQTDASPESISEDQACEEVGWASDDDDEIIDRNPCCTPADSSLEDQVFYTPREGRSPAGILDEHGRSQRGPDDTFGSGAVYVSYSYQQSDSTVVAEDADPVIAEQEHHGEALPRTSSPPRATLPESLSPSGLCFFPGVSSRVASGHRSLSVYSDNPPPSDRVRRGGSTIGEWDPTLRRNKGKGMDAPETEPLEGELEGSPAACHPKVVKSQPTVPLVTGPRGGSPGPAEGGIQVRKRSVTAPVRSRFLENFEESLETLDRRHHRVSSEGWLSGGRRSGYGYEFVEGPKETAVPETPVPIVDGLQNVECLPIEEDVEDLATTVEDVDVHSGPSEETPSPLRRRALLFPSWAKLPAAVKWETSPLRTLLKRNAEHTTPGDPSAPPTKENNLAKRAAKSRRLFRPWSRLVRMNSTSQHHQIDTEEAAENPVGDTADGHGDSMASTEGDTDVGSQDHAHCDTSPDPCPTNRGPGGYDGPFDVEPESSMGVAGPAHDPYQTEGSFLAEINSAEEWSRLYKDCLPHLSLSEETVNTTYDQ